MAGSARGVVGGLQPELEDDVVFAPFLGAALVQSECELPWRGVEAFEACVHPSGQRTLEPSVAVVGGQLGIAAHQGAENVGDGRGPVPAVGHQSDARLAQPVASDGVDCAGVQVAYGSVAFAVERVGANLGEGVCQDVELCVDDVVDGCAPEGVPPACRRLELWVDESLRDRAAGEVEHGERDACATSESEFWGRTPGENAEFSDSEAASREGICAFLGRWDGR